MPKLWNGSKGDSNPGSLDWESGIVSLNYCEHGNWGVERWLTTDSITDYTVRIGKTADRQLTGVVMGCVRFFQMIIGSDEPVNDAG